MGCVRGLSYGLGLGNDDVTSDSVARREDRIAVPLYEPSPPNSPTPSAEPATARLPAFDAAVVKKIPNDVSRVAFFDRWINRRIDEAVAAGNQLDGRLASFSQAQAGMHKLLEAIRAGVAGAQPVLDRLQSTPIDAEAIGRQAVEAAELAIERALADSRHALEGALEPVELDCARRLEAMLAQAHSQMESAARCAIANTRQQLGQMHEQMLTAAQEISRSIQATLTSAEQAARQLSLLVEQTIRAEQTVRMPLADAELLAREGNADRYAPTSDGRGRITETAGSVIEQVCRATEELHERFDSEIDSAQAQMEQRIADASVELAGHRNRMVIRPAQAPLPRDTADEVAAAADEALRVLNWIADDAA
jgi:hypothetical protein